MIVVVSKKSPKVDTSNFQNNMSVCSATNCANCGKDEDEIGHLKTCNGCYMVKYCSRECQATHRPQHKKACKKRAAELHDEKLFKEVEREECPVCFLPFPHGEGTTFVSCCGKTICSGCIHGMSAEAISRGKDMHEVLCAFCRTPAPPSFEEDRKRTKKQMESGNAFAYYQFAGFHVTGTSDIVQDLSKAHDLSIQAGQLGCATAYFNLGKSYDHDCTITLGRENNQKKAKHYYELAAMGGNMEARNNLAVLEYKAGNYDRAFRHYTIAAKAGNHLSLDSIELGFANGFVTKDEYESVLRAYQKSQDEMKSEMRERAADAMERVRHLF